MNILVTGGAGYIGSIVVKELLRLNNRVIVVDNLQEGHREAVLPEAIFFNGNIGDRYFIKNIFSSHEIDSVIHLAAETTIEFSMKEPGLYFRNNVINGITLLWQVNGRNVINDFDDWARLDLQYIDNWSIWLGMKILFLTAITVIRGSGR